MEFLVLSNIVNIKLIITGSNCDKTNDLMVKIIRFTEGHNMKHESKWIDKILPKNTTAEHILKWNAAVAIVKSNTCTWQVRSKSYALIKLYFL